MKSKAMTFAAVAMAIGAIVPNAAPAAEPAHFAIMGVRLSMSSQEVLAVLYAQGVRDNAISESVHPCAMHAAVACTGGMIARLPDGSIRVRFADTPPGYGEAREAAFSITYRSDDGADQGQLVRAVAEERFGRFSDPADATWCAPDQKGVCPIGQPRMTFHALGQGGDEMALTDLGLPLRLATEMPDHGRGQPERVR